MAKAGSIDIFLNANTTKFDDGLKRVNKGIRDFARGGADLAGTMLVLQNAIGVITKAFGAFNAHLGKLDETADIATRFDITADSVQKLRRAVQLSGADFGSFNTSMAKLAVNLGDAANGKGSAVNALNELGLSAKELQSMSLDRSFETIARAIGKLPDPTRRAAAATDIFGKSATEMMEIFTRQGVFEQAGREIATFAAKLDRDATDKIGEAAESMERLGMAWEGLKDELAVSAAPKASEMAEGGSFLLALLRNQGPQFTDSGIRPMTFDIAEEVRRQNMARFDPDRLPENLPPLTPAQMFAGTELGDKIAEDNRIREEMKSVFADFEKFKRLPETRAWNDAIDTMRTFYGVAGEGFVPPSVKGAALPPGGLPNLRQMFMGGNPEFSRSTPNFSLPGGAAALEAGSVGAYSAIQRAQRDDEANRLNRQQLEEQRRQTKKLDDIFQTIEQGFDVATVGLQA